MQQILTAITLNFIPLQAMSHIPLRYLQVSKPGRRQEQPLRALNNVNQFLRLRFLSQAIKESLKAMSEIREAGSRQPIVLNPVYCLAILTLERRIGWAISVAASAPQSATPIHVTVRCQPHEAPHHG